MKKIKIKILFTFECMISLKINICKYFFYTFMTYFKKLKKTAKGVSVLFRTLY